MADYETTEADNDDALAIRNAIQEACHGKIMLVVMAGISTALSEIISRIENEDDASAVFDTVFNNVAESCGWEIEKEETE